MSFPFKFSAGALLFIATSCLTAQSNEQLIADDPGRIISLKKADFNGDGRQDILAASVKYLSWLENTPTTNTHYFRHEPIGLIPYNAVTAVEDMDGDGDTDALVACDTAIWWYPNNGSGQFGHPLTISSTGAEYATPFDLDGDGDQDVISVQGQSLVWQKNLNGTGQIFSDTFYISYKINARIWPMDVDGDGDPDLVFNHYFGGFPALAWRENLDGHANFSPVNKLAPNPFENVFLIDFDADGDKDLVGNHFLNRFGWCEKTAAGFSPVEVIGNPNQVISSIDIGDMNGDDLPEIVAGTDGAIWRLDNYGPEFVELNVIFQEDYFREIVLTDSDQDGDRDIMAGNWETSVLYRFENNNNFGELEPPVLVNIRTRGVLALATGDLDGDGDPDVVAGCGYDVGDRKISWFPNDGGRFRREHLFPVNAFDPTSLVCRDIDGDGDIDVLATDRSSAGVVWYENMDGTGKFDSMHVFGTQDGPLQVVAEDLDKDGDPDALVTSFDDGRVSWYRNLDGKGNFGPQILIDELVDPFSVAVIDIDQNNLPDVVVTTGNVSVKTLVYKSITPGVFDQTPVQLGAAGGQVMCKSGQLDGDGRADLVILGNYDAVVLRSSNNFQPEHYGAFQGGYDLCVSNLDQTAGDEFVVATYADTNFVLLFSNTDGAGHFNNGARIIKHPVWRIATADFNGDGRNDLVAGDHSGLFWLANESLSSTNIPSSIENESISIFPNPFSNELNIKDFRENREPVMISVFDLTGRRIAEKYISAQENWVLHGIPSGMYLFHIIDPRNGKEITTGKLIRN